MLRLCIIIITVWYVSVTCRDVVIANLVGHLWRRWNVSRRKAKNLMVFTWKRILKVTPLSSKLHGYIGWRLTSQIKIRRIIKGLRFVKKKKREKKQASIRRKLRQTIPLTCFGKYTGTWKRVNLRKYQVLYTCCGPVRLICTRMMITDDSVLKLNHLVS